MIASDAVLIGGGGAAALLVIAPVGLWLWRRRTPARIDGPEEAVAAVEQMLPYFPSTPPWSARTGWARWH